MFKKIILASLGIAALVGCAPTATDHVTTTNSTSPANSQGETSPNSATTKSKAP